MERRVSIVHAALLSKLFLFCVTALAATVYHLLTWRNKKVFRDVLVLTEHVFHEVLADIRGIAARWNRVARIQPNVDLCTALGIHFNVFQLAR